MYKIAALYRFVEIENPIELKEKIQEVCEKNNIKGTLILANEGINGTIASQEENIDSMLHILMEDERFQNLELKFSYASKRPFSRLKIHIKKEIVTFGHEVSQSESGEYVKAENWNQLISDPNVVVIDTRNDYEVQIGTFKGAINPKTKTFREFANFVHHNLDAKKHKKVAMFCTGGIRCEKSTSYLKKLGFNEVYHLQGGILRYLEEINADNSLWEGECFVFDERTAVSHGLRESQYVFCRGCRMPISPEDKKHQHFLENIHCHHCYPTLTDKKLRSSQERQRQIQLAKDRAS